MNVLNIDRIINLRKEYQSVKEDFAEAVLDRAENVIKKEVLIKSTYQSHFGMYELAILKTEVERRMLLRKLELANEYMKANKDIDEDKIREIAESEQLGLLEIIKNKKSRIQKANDFLKRDRLNTREKERMKDSMKLLTLKLHPVLNKKSDEKSIMILERALDAFIDDNYGKMRMLENILDASCEKEENIDEKTMVKEIERIRRAIADEVMQAALERREKVFEMEDLVFNLKKVEEQKEALKNELKIEQQARDDLKYKLDLLEKIYNFNVE